MPNRNLLFNILTFDFPEEEQTFYFSTEEIGVCNRLHWSLFPKQIESIFPGITTDGTEFIYTTFRFEKDGYTPLVIDFRTDTPDLIKKYYNREIYYYFKKGLKHVVKSGYINENIVWLPSTEQSQQFDIYERFSLKVQLCTVSSFPELVISYDGKSRVLKKSVAELTSDVSPTLFNYILQGQSLFKFEKMADFEDPDYDTAYPVLNNNLRKGLGIPAGAPIKGNRYLKYFDNIKDFYDEFLNTDNFREVIPLNNIGFLKVAPTRINNTNDESNDLAFGNNQKGRIPKYDVRKLKPYQKSPWSKIHLFFIVHRDDAHVAITLKEYFEKGFKWFKGLYDFAYILFHTENHFSIVFTDKDNPLQEIEERLNERNFNPEVKYIAIYVTPFSRFEDDEEKRIVYYRVKEMLLQRNITSQAIEAQKVIDPDTDYVYSLPNIAVAMLAKLNGIPWRLHTPIKNELILGVGAFRHIRDGVQYIGSAFSFNNLGSFNSFDYFMRHETDLLAGCIAAKVREYASINNAPDRLIIHFYKKLSQKELEPIEKALAELELPNPIPIYIITINKTEAEDIVAFDMDYKELMPESGIYINIGENKYLLFNNTRYPGSTVSATDGFPFPVKLAIDCKDKEKLKDVKVVNELINQVYQFSRMYWKSVRQQNLPVTIKYPEMVAQIAPYFVGDDIPLYGKNNLWFL